MTNSAPLPRQQTGAVFIDGVYVLGGVASVNTVDVERVEVLKGPQSAYFGRNTFGGAVNFITRNPGREFKGQVNAEVDEWGSNNASLSLEGPLAGDPLAGRLSLVRYNKLGHYTANDGGRLGDEGTSLHHRRRCTRPRPTASGRGCACTTRKTRTARPRPRS